MSSIHVPSKSLRSFGTSDRRSIDDWRSRAECLGEDPDLFFPIGIGGPSLIQIDEAKVVCARCPVKTDCLTFGISSRATDGIWGGLTTKEIRRGQRAKTRKSQSRRTRSAPQVEADGPAETSQLH
jgi:WhiB family redox-sensing transcriptional regulator